MEKKQRGRRGQRLGDERKYEPNNKDRLMIRNLRAAGIHVKDICAILSSDRKSGSVMSKATLYKYYRDELENAVPLANASVANALFNAAVKTGNVQAMKFWLQCRADWVPSEERKITGDLPTTFTLNINGKTQDLSNNSEELTEEDEE